MASGLGNTCQSDALKLLFQNTNWANVGNAGGLLQSTVAGSFFVGLSTGTLSGASTQSTTEAAYTGYARVAVARASGSWSISGSSPTSVTNVSAVTFPACTAGSETETYFVVGRDTSGTGESLWYGALTAGLAVSNGITPSFAASALTCTLD
jgi:hypothetical protein